MTQEIIVFAIVGAAAFYIARMLWNATRGQSDCGCGKDGGCGSKPKAKSSTRSLDETPLIQVKTTVAPRRK